MSCATTKCDDPTCGPCTIYERFPLLRKLQARSSEADEEAGFVKRGKSWNPSTPE